jgi:hypothetical protein
MKKKISIILISILFIIISFSGCTEFDGDDGFFDWLTDDEGNVQGGYDYCYVYGYATITVLDSTGPEGHQVSIYFDGDTEVITTHFQTAMDGYIENAYLGHRRLEKDGFGGLIKIFIYDKVIDSKTTKYFQRALSFDDASAGGTRDRYDWVETFAVTFE